MHSSASGTHPIKFQEHFEHTTMVMCGDLDSRIGMWDEYVEEENDLDDEIDELHNSACACEQLKSPRALQDKVNNFGKNLNEHVQNSSSHSS